MRLTCPKCGATYALDAEAIRQGGSHVQCGACHTRWFVRPDRPAADAPSEDQIVQRLESRAARQPVERDPTVESGADAARAAAPIPFPGPMRPVAAPPAVSAPAPEPKAPEAESPGPALSPAAATTPLRPRAPVERPSPVQPPAPVGAPPATAQPRGSAALGFLAAGALAGAALALYLRADAVAAQAPAAAPALAAYSDAVDEGRFWIEARLGPLRDQLLGG